MVFSLGNVILSFFRLPITNFLKPRFPFHGIVLFLVHFWMPLPLQTVLRASDWLVTIGKCIMLFPLEVPRAEACTTLILQSLDNRNPP